jgi:trk system potassium uptake protein TrkA
MNIIIVGCGRVGAELAFRLHQRNHRIAIIDNTHEAFLNLHPDFSGRTIEGEALSREVLYRAGIGQADGLAAVTNSDSMNAVIAHIARTEFKIPAVFVRNFDPRWRPMHEAFGFQIVSSSSWGAQRIEELLYHSDMRTVFSAGNGEVEIYEVGLPDSWSNRPLGELISDTEAIPVALTRIGRSFLPSPETILERDDILALSATSDGIETIRQRINTFQEA